MPVILSIPGNFISSLWKKKSVKITEADPTFKVTYIGNVPTSYAKGEGCEEKPLQIIWKSYKPNAAKLQMPMELTICSSGMKAYTKKHGHNQYWANRITYCCASKDYPGIFCWVYRHENPKMKPEVRCHAAICSKPEQAKELVNLLTARLSLALQEFRREKLTRQKARLSLANSCYDCPSMPQRKILLSRGTINFRPPVEMSKIAPKLKDIEEDLQQEEEEEKFFDWLRKMQESPTDHYLYLEYSSSLDSDISSSRSSSFEDSSPRHYNLLGSLNSLGESSTVSMGSDGEMSEEFSEISEESVDLSEHALLLS